MAKKIEAGLTKTVFIGHNMYAIVSNSASYKAEVRQVARVMVEPHVALSAFLSAHRDKMRRPAIVAFKELILEAQKGWVRK